MTDLEALTSKITELENKVAELEEQKRNNNQSVECELCHKIFKNKYILKTHIKNIHVEQRESFTCQHCGKQLKSKYYLQYHISHLHNEKVQN